MSETTETTAPAVQLPPGMTMTTKLQKVAMMNGSSSDELRATVTFGSPARTVTVVDLDLAAQFDLAEVTGGTDNIEYRNFAFVAASVRDIDGHPVPLVSGGPSSKSFIRSTLKQLGREGFKAAAMAIQSFAGGAANAATDEEHKAAVGNF